MAVLVNSFDGGAAGTTVTTGNSGGTSGDSFTLTQSVSGGICTYSSTGAAHGPLCMQVTTGGTGGAERRGWSVNSSDSTSTQWFRFYFDRASVTGTVSPLRGMNVGSGGQRFRVQVSAAGVVQLLNSSNTSVWSSAAVASGVQWRVEVAAGGTTSASARISIFEGDATVASQDSGALSGVNLGGPIREVWFGQTNAATNVAVRLDECGWSDTAPLGPAATVAPAEVVCGPWAGAVTDGGFTVGYVLSGVESGVESARLAVSASSDLSTPTWSTAVAPDGDGFVHLPVSGLAADTVYYYGLEADGLLLADGRGRVRTDPPAGMPASFAVAFGSCQYDTPTTGSFTAVAARSGPHGGARRLIHMGDLNYRDWASGTTAGQVRAQHVTSLGSTAMAPMLTSVPLTYCWDNHDWGGSDSDRNSPAGPVVAQVHRQVFPSYLLPATDGRGVWQSWVIGRVRFIQLDTRSQRDNRTAVNGPSKTLLGAEQKAWLFDRLTDPEPVKVICSNQYWRQDGANGDRWGSFPHEFAEVNDFIDAHASGRVYAIFGDRHALCADDGTSAGTRGVPQAGGAPFQQGSTGSFETWSAGYYDTAGTTMTAYGWLDVSDTGSAVTVAYSGFTADGTLRVSQSTVFVLEDAASLTGVTSSAGSVGHAAGATSAGAGTSAGVVSVRAGAFTAGSTPASAALTSAARTPGTAAVTAATAFVGVGAVAAAAGGAAGSGAASIMARTRTAGSLDSSAAVEHHGSSGPLRAAPHRVRDTTPAATVRRTR
ncbi:alkaline phosphatase D family protein [Micromonospora sp. NPDC000207]|uniref:alkaline phosphatase D family protein n=1 Tax=Micromonospora sp. NPDC000207 TaxID=3154246 RepID=UPI00331681B9